MDVARARSPDQRPAIYRPRQAWLTPLYRLLEARYESVKAQWEERFESRFGFWRGCVEGIVTRFLDCGILDNGFARVRCTGCRKDMLVAFSCKGRGLCPSCAAKRAAETANRLREEVLEPVGHAQWVFTIPKMLRPYFMRHRELLGGLCRAAWDTVREMVITTAGEEIRPGMVAVIQTFGSTINFHPHVHAIVSRGGWTVDGVWVPIPWIDATAAELLFRHKVLSLLRDAGLIDEVRIALLLSWKHTGFSVHNAVTIEPEDAGATERQTIETRPILSEGKVVDLRQEARNNARMLIEDFMIASNGVSARFLENRKLSSIRRVVRSPERWDRIEKIASDLGDKLPPDPDAEALEQFLLRQKKKDLTRFPDLSLSIVKAMGPGEYVLERPGEKPIGHFGLAVKDYAHSTAPNRRYPDLITHRLLKAAMANGKAPYSDDELASLAEHCTRQEDAANKVERQVRKSAAALLLQDKIGEKFDAIVTGASSKGTWVRIFHPPIEGKVVHGEEGLDIGERTRVKLVHADPERGHIDFVRSGR